MPRLPSGELGRLIGYTRLSSTMWRAVTKGSQRSQKPGVCICKLMQFVHEEQVSRRQDDRAGGLVRMKHGQLGLQDGLNSATA
jgi:hypothetical protein